MPHKNDKGYHVTFPGLQCCEADGPDPEDTARRARRTAYNWLYLEIEEKTSKLPPQTHVENIRLEEGEFLKQITVIVKLFLGND